MGSAGLHGAERFDFGEGEVTGEEGGGLDAIERFRGFPGGELGAGLDVGGVVEDGFVTGDEMAVFNGNKVGLDIVGAEFNGAAVAFDGVFRKIAGSAASMLGGKGQPRRPGHAFLARVEKRYRNGSFSYTFSNFIDNVDALAGFNGTPGAGFQDYYIRRLDKLISELDFTHWAAFSTVYELPFWTGSRHLLGYWPLSVLGTIAGGPL